MVIYPFVVGIYALICKGFTPVIDLWLARVLFGTGLQDTLGLLQCVWTHSLVMSVVSRCTYPALTSLPVHDHLPVGMGLVIGPVIDHSG